VYAITPGDDLDEDSLLPEEVWERGTLRLMHVINDARAHAHRMRSETNHPPRGAAGPANRLRLRAL
jgi:hypothetical protein